MCRMLVAIGEIEVNNLIDDLILIAKGQNEIHEKNPVYGKLMHADGWGIAYLSDSHNWTTYKSTKSIFSDHNIDKIKNIRAKVIVLHVRKATVGEKSLENTQPFSYNDEYVFAHNGTIFDEIENKHRYVTGDSDSARWFNKLISELNSNKERNIKESLNFNDFTSANFIFASKNKIIIGQKFKTTPKYCTMKMFHDEKNTIISSEVLPKYKDKNWTQLTNGELIELNLD